jgi:hypothetical protein
VTERATGLPIGNSRQYGARQPITNLNPNPNPNQEFTTMEYFLLFVVLPPLVFFCCLSWFLLIGKIDDWGSPYRAQEKARQIANGTYVSPWNFARNLLLLVVVSPLLPAALLVSIVIGAAWCVTDAFRCNDGTKTCAMVASALLAAPAFAFLGVSALLSSSVWMVPFTLITASIACATFVAFAVKVAVQQLNAKLAQRSAP